MSGSRAPTSPADSTGLPPLPSPSDVKTQLERILASEDFRPPKRAGAFLRYVVEETVAGRGERIKGYSIAVEVFGRDEGFSQDDPIVRIEASRLRRALERYYLVAENNGQLRIDIPKGRYIPTFSWTVPIDDEAAADPVSASGTPSGDAFFNKPKRKLAMSGLFAATIGVICLAFWLSGGARSVLSQPEVPDIPALVIAPFADLGSEPEARLYAAGLAEELIVALVGFKELTVFGRETSAGLPPGVEPSEVRDRLGARFLLAGGVRVAGDRVRVTARLSDVETSAILWSQTYDDDLRSSDLLAIQADVAGKVARAIAQPYGVIAQAGMTAARPDDLGAYRCTLQFYVYRTELTPEKHLQVRDCLEQAVARFPSYSTALAMLSIVYIDEDRFGFNPRKGSPSSLERALDASRKAVDIEPLNMRALQALMTALSLNQRLAESLEVGERGYAINPNDTEFIGEFGTRLALSGQWDRGAALLRTALAGNPGRSGFYRGVLALAAYMKKDNGTAVLEIRQADLAELPLFHLVAAIIYAESGMGDEAQREGASFVSMRPDFLANIESELEKRNIRGEDQNRLIAGIRKAGLTVHLNATRESRRRAAQK